MNRSVAGVPLISLPLSAVTLALAVSLLVIAPAAGAQTATSTYGFDDVLPLRTSWPTSFPFGYFGEEVTRTTREGGIIHVADGVFLRNCACGQGDATTIYGAGPGSGGSIVVDLWGQQSGQTNTAVSGISFILINGGATTGHYAVNYNATIGIRGMAVQVPARSSMRVNLPQDADGSFLIQTFDRSALYFIDDVTWSFQSAAPPKFEFEYKEGQPDERLLLHKWLDSDRNGPFAGYLSSYQVTTDASGQPLPPALPPLYRLPGTVTVNGAPSSQMVYFRVIDPPDTAPYVPNPAANDNRDTSRPKGRLVTVDQNGQRIDTAQIQSNVDGVIGRAVIYLEGSDHVSGDNYQVEASFDPTFPCATAGPSNAPDICAKSAKIVTWKRVYIEEHDMFRRGAFLAAPVQIGDRTIIVGETPAGTPPPFGGGDTIRLIHGGAGGPSWSEDVVIDPHPVDAAGKALRPIEPDTAAGAWLARLSSPTLHTYDGPGGSRLGFAVPNSATYYYADAVGVPGAGSYFVPDTGSLAAFYADMFVDVQPVPGQHLRDLPFLPEIQPRGGPVVSPGPSVLTKFRQAAGPNVFQLIGAGAYARTPGIDAAGNPTCSTHYGDTDAGSPAANASWLYIGNMEESIAGTMTRCTIAFLAGHSLTGMNRASVAHEITHQWLVNHDPLHPYINTALTPPGIDGHCTAPAAVPPGLSGDMCLMNRNWPLGIINWSQLDSPRLALHWLDNGADSEYIQVRTHAEPATQ